MVHWIEIGDIYRPSGLLKPEAHGSRWIGMFRAEGDCISYASDRKHIYTTKWIFLFL